jgi:hypothetical protein
VQKNASASAWLYRLGNWDHVDNPMFPPGQTTYVSGKREEELGYLLENRMCFGSGPITVTMDTGSDDKAPHPYRVAVNFQAWYSYTIYVDDFPSLVRLFSELAPLLQVSQLCQWDGVPPSGKQ